MNLRTTMLLLLVAAGLGIWIFFVERKGETTKQREEQARKALQLEQRRVTGFTFTAGTNPVVTCAQVNGKWRLTAPVAARADAAVVDRLLSGLAEAKRGEVITAQDRTQRGTTLSDYGLEPARCSIALELGGRKQTVLFGRTAPVGDSIYIKDSARNDVVATEAGVTNNFPAEVTTLRDHALFNGSAFDVKRLDLRGGGRLIQLAKNERGDWALQQPLMARADRAAVQDVLDALFDWKVTQFVGDGVADFAAYGLDENATKVTVNAGDKVNEQVLLVGKQAGTNAALVYAATPPEKSVLGVSTDALAKVNVKINDLRDRRLLTLATYDIAGLLLQQGEKKLELKKAANGEWNIIQPRATKADSQRVEDFLTQITNVKIEDFLDQAAANPATLGLAEPAWRVRLSKAALPAGAGAAQKNAAPGENEQVVLISSQQRAGGRGVVRLEHEATPYEIPGAVLTNLTVEPLVFRNREVLNIHASDVLKMTRVTTDSTQVVERASATNAFVVVVPNKEAADQGQMNGLLNTFSVIQAQRLVAADAKDLSPFGLTQPGFSLTLGMKGDASLSKTILIGAAVDGGRYAMVRGQDIIFVLDAEAAMLLTKGWLKPAPAPVATNETTRAATNTNAAGQRP